MIEKRSFVLTLRIGPMLPVEASVSHEARRRIPRLVSMSVIGC